MLIIVINPMLLKVLWVFFSLFWREKRLKTRYTSMLTTHVSILVKPLQTTAFPEWQVLLNLSVLGSCTLSCLQGRFCTLHLPITIFWYIGKTLSIGGVCFLWAVEMLWGNYYQGKVCLRTGCFPNWGSLEMQINTYCSPPVFLGLVNVLLPPSGNSAC